MWWLLLLSASDVGARELRVTLPPLARDEVVTAPAPRMMDARFDLRTLRAVPDQRLADLDEAAVPTRRRHPLAVSAIDDDRQRLIIGVKPGPGKNKLGVAYRLRLGR